MTDLWNSVFAVIVMGRECEGPYLFDWEADAKEFARLCPEETIVTKEPIYNLEAARYLIQNMKKETQS